MTIELIDDIVQLAQTIDELGGRVYRSYPNVDAMVDVPYAVVSPSGRNVLQQDADGSELVVMLAYSFDLFASSIEELDGIFLKLNALYNSKGLSNQGYNTAYNTSAEVYSATASWSGVVDVRGGVHRG